MRYLKPHFYDKFVCTAGDCPDTCCAGWQIMIDEDSLEKYKSVQGSLENVCIIRSTGKRSASVRMTGGARFLNDENLCDLYKALGPDAFAIPAAFYPRHTEEFEGLRNYPLSLSCPEAAKIILSCKEPVRFIEEETDEEDDFDEFDFMMFSRLEDTRDVLFSVLQDRNLPLTLRMAACEQLAERYQICMEEGREFEIDDLLQNANAITGMEPCGSLYRKVSQKRAWMRHLFISGSGRRKNFRCFTVWNVCARSGMMCWMVLKSGCIREAKRNILRSVRNFTGCMGR